MGKLRNLLFVFVLFFCNAEKQGDSDMIGLENRLKPPRVKMIWGLTALRRNVLGKKVHQYKNISTCNFVIQELPKDHPVKGCWNNASRIHLFK